MSQHGNILIEKAIWLGRTLLTSASSPYYVTNDSVIYLNCTGGAITSNLPPATGSGRILFFKKTDSSANAATLDGNASETIDDETTVVISSQYDCVMIQDYDVGKWAIL